MGKDTVTFELGGRVEIKDLENGIIAFRRLISALTPKDAQITWVVEDLQPGSATATFRCDTDAPSVAAEIVKKYERIGDMLSRNEGLSFCGKRVRRAAESIAALTKSVEYVRFETSESDYMIRGKDLVTVDAMPSNGIGAITGQVQTLSNRGGLRFNLYDTIHDKAIACYLLSGQEELMREAWGKQAIVSGNVSREAFTGRPIAIRQIMSVEVLEDVPRGAYRNARGAMPWEPNYKKPEEIIRQIRDA